MFEQLFINFLLVIGILIFWQFGQALGMRILRRSSLTELQPLEAIIIATAAGWITIGLIIYLLGQFGLILPLVLGIGAVLLTVIMLREEPWQISRKLKIAPWFSQLPLIGKFVLLVIACLASINLLSALTPDVWFDSTWYHLPEAQLYLEHHTTRLSYPSILDISSVAPRLPEMLFTFLLAPAPGLSALPQLFHWLAGIGLVIGTYILARRIVQPEFALLAGLIVYGTKIVGWLSQTAYIDLIQTFFGIATLIAIIALKPGKSDWSRAGIIGLLLGGFMASKMQSLAFYPVFFLVLLGTYLHSNANFKANWKHYLRELTRVTGISLIILIPWYLEIWLVTGSPLFIFQQPSGSVLLGGGQTFTDWVFSIHPTTFTSEIYSMLITDAPLLLLSLLVLLYWRSLPKFGRVIFWAGWLAILLWSYFPVHLDRYGLLAFPLLAIPVAWLASYNRVLFATILASTLAIIGFNSSIYRQILTDRWPVATGIVAREDYLTNNLAGHNLIFYDPGDIVARIVGDGTALTLVHNPFYLTIPSIDAIRLKATSYGQLTTIDEVIAQWKSVGITHLLIHGPWVLETFVDQTEFPGGGTALPWSEREKIENYVTLRYTHNYTSVWELR